MLGLTVLRLVPQPQTASRHEQRLEFRLSNDLGVSIANAGQIKAANSPGKTRSQLRSSFSPSKIQKLDGAVVAVANVRVTGANVSVPGNVSVTKYVTKNVTTPVRTVEATTVVNCSIGHEQQLGIGLSTDLGVSMANAGQIKAAKSLQWGSNWRCTREASCGLQACSSDWKCRFKCSKCINLACRFGNAGRTS